MVQLPLPDALALLGPRVGKALRKGFGFLQVRMGQRGRPVVFPSALCSVLTLLQSVLVTFLGVRSQISRRPHGYELFRCLTASWGQRRAAALHPACVCKTPLSVVY